MGAVPSFLVWALGEHQRPSGCSHSFVRAARAQETNSLHTPTPCVRIRGAQEQRGWQSIPFCWASTRKASKKTTRLPVPTPLSA